jgi:hypothetical protein
MAIFQSVPGADYLIQRNRDVLDGTATYKASDDSFGFLDASTAAPDGVGGWPVDRVSAVMGAMSTRACSSRCKGDNGGTGDFCDGFLGDLP